MSIVSLDSDSHNQHVEATAFSVCHRHRGISRANVHTTDKSKVSTRAENKFESWFHLFRAIFLVVQLVQFEVCWFDLYQAKPTSL